MADLQQSVTSVMLQKDKLSRENAQMSMLLDQKVNSGAAVPTWKPGFTLGEDSQTSFRYGDAIVLRKHSLAASSGRVAVTPVRSYQPTHAPTLDSTTIAKPEMSTSGDAEHAWDAVDFILALETPCRDHVNLPAHIAHQSDHAASEQGGPSNHAMTMTAAVYARTVSLGHCHPGTIDGHASTYGFVPHFEIERLLGFSRALEVNDGYITPVQIYASLKEQARSQQHLKDMLERLRGPLASYAECCGFGSVLPAEKFWEVVSQT